jgi:hypothetical protein
MTDAFVWVQRKQKYLTRQGAKHAKDIIDFAGAASAANCSQAQTDVRG